MLSSASHHSMIRKKYLIRDGTRFSDNIMPHFI